MVTRGDRPLVRKCYGFTAVRLGRTSADVSVKFRVTSFVLDRNRLTVDRTPARAGPDRSDNAH